MTQNPVPDLDGAALREARERPEEQLAAIWERDQPGLRRMLELRMDPRLRARVGASDVLQETWIEAQSRLGEYLATPASEAMPLKLWLRFLAAQRLLQARRFHVEAERRAGGREVTPGAFAGLGTSVAGAADVLAASMTSPGDAVLRAELHGRLLEALEQLPETDREVLVRRHVEGLSNLETARELGIDPSAASKRFLRALERLRELLGDVGPSNSP